jgi:hypothetical protein
MLTEVKERLLASVLGKEEHREAAKAEYAWRAKVSRYRVAVEEELREKARLDRNVESAMKEFRAVEPMYKKACARLGFARRERDAIGRDLSQATYTALMDAENSAPPAFAQLRKELWAEIEAARKTRIDEVSEPTGEYDKRGNPRYRTRSTAASIAARCDRIRALIAELDDLRSKEADSLQEELDRIRASVPPAEYRLND